GRTRIVARSGEVRLLAAVQGRADAAGTSTRVIRPCGGIQVVNVGDGDQVIRRSRVRDRRRAVADAAVAGRFADADGPVVDQAVKELVEGAVAHVVRGAKSE